ncbi:unnamed protein product [Parnassius apollo]|uniref:(apollo) hypothetical protein n=1 Tax=Parnassius apollo TaxID=110799 RepID=A0A8S3XK85_PARAO|nr:unnamed protein product [Parnassius apollo]
MDARQQERILHWLEEEEEEILGGEDDEDENHIYPDETSEYNTDSAQECDDGDPETQDHVSESSEDQQKNVDSSDSDDNEPLIHMSSQNFYFVKKKKIKVATIKKISNGGRHRTHRASEQGDRI